MLGTVPILQKLSKYYNVKYMNSFLQSYTPAVYTHLLYRISQLNNVYRGNNIFSIH